MPALHSEITHNLEATTVRHRLDDLLESVRTEYAGMVRDLRCSWEGDTLHISFRAYGFDIASDVHVGAERVEWDGHIPTRATLFVGKIKRTIDHKLAEVLGTHMRTGTVEGRRAA
jgi:hypothetical protein